MAQYQQAELSEGATPFCFELRRPLRCDEHPRLVDAIRLWRREHFSSHSPQLLLFTQPNYLSGIVCGPPDEQVLNSLAGCVGQAIRSSVVLGNAHRLLPERQVLIVLPIVEGAKVSERAYLRTQLPLAFSSWKTSPFCGLDLPGHHVGVPSLLLHARNKEKPIQESLGMTLIARLTENARPGSIFERVEVLANVLERPSHFYIIHGGMILRFVRVDETVDTGWQ